jgi:signal peptidase I
MIVLRRIALIVLWALAAVGIVSGAMWGLSALGVVKPLVVISGSMEPEIMTGDLLIATHVASSELAVGDVVSLPSELTDNLVTHRIQTIAASGEDGYTITLKGDANEFEDALDYQVSGEVWKPQIQVPGVGTAIMRLSTPAVAVPLLLGLVGLLGLVWLVPAPARGRRAEDPTTSVGTDVAEPGSAGAAGGTAPAGPRTRREARRIAESEQ